MMSVKIIICISDESLAETVDLYKKLGVPMQQPEWKQNLCEQQTFAIDVECASQHCPKHQPVGSPKHRFDQP